MADMDHRLVLDTAPGLCDIEALASRAFEALPPIFRDACEGLVIRVEDFASAQMLASVGCRSPFELTGLYDGVALTAKSGFEQPQRPDTVWLFRRAILEEWIERGDVALNDLVAHVLVHEIAHHFGWSDDEIMQVDDWRL